jgi:hypothetical protein
LFGPPPNGLCMSSQLVMWSGSAALGRVQTKRLKNTQLFCILNSLMHIDCHKKNDCDAYTPTDEYCLNPPTSSALSAIAIYNGIVFVAAATYRYDV